MAWYDDPNLVNPDSLPQDDTTGVTPALPAAPVAVRPSPFAAINQQLEQDLQQMQQPRGLQALPPMGPTYTPEEWTALQAQGKPAADAPRTYAPLTGLTVLGNELAPSNLWTQGKAAVARLAEDSDPFQNNDWRDEWRAAAAVKDEENRRYAAEQAKAAAKPGTEAYFMPGVKIDEVGGLGSNLAFSAAGMAGTIGGRATGAATGAAIGSAVGTPGVGTVAGGIIGGLFGGGAMAYKQQQVMFLEQLHNHLDQQSRLENKKPLDPEVWKKTFSDPEIQAAMQDSALWEAGPEAVGNMLFLKLNKLGFSRNLSDGAWKKALKATGAVVANAAQEQGTETVTQLAQHNAEIRAGMRPESERRSWLNPSDIKKSSDEVFAQTLLLSGVMGGAGGVISKAHEAVIQNPRDAANLIDLASDPNVREALPTEALGNLATLGQWLQSRKLVSNDQLPGVVNTLQAEWAARQNEDPAITSQREAYLAKLYAAAPDDSPIKATLNELWNGEKQEKLPGWVRLLDDSTDYGLRGEFNKDGTPTGNINLQGLNQLKPTLDIAGMGIRGARTRTLQDQINQANFEGEFDPTAGDVVDDQGRVWKRDPNTNTLTLAPIPAAPAGLNTVTPVAPSTPAAPAAPIIKPEPAENLTPTELSAHQAALDRISKVKPGTPEYAREIAVLDYYSKPGTKPSETWNKKPEQPGLNTLTPTQDSPPPLKSETAPALPPTPHPEPVIVGGTPVESVKQGVTDLLNRQKQQLADLAAKAAQTPAAPSLSSPSPTEEVSTGEGIKAGFKALGGSAGEGARRKIASDLSSGQQVVYTKQASIDAARSNPGYSIEDLPDGSVRVIGVLDPDTNQWVGTPPASAQTPTAPAAPAPTPTLPTPALPDSTPAASSPVSAPSQDSSTAPVGNEAGSVAQSETSAPAPAATGPAIQPTTENADGLQAEAQAPLTAETPASQEAGGKKEPWEMTSSEYLSSIGHTWNKVDRGTVSKQKVVNSEKFHRVLVESAIAEGKTVPAEVLAGYPDLAPKQAKPTTDQVVNPTAAFEALIDPENGNILRGGDVINAMLKPLSAADLVTVKDWARKRSGQASRWIGDAAAAEQRYRSNQKPEIKTGRETWRTDATHLNQETLPSVLAVVAQEIAAANIKLSENRAKELAAARIFNAIKNKYQEIDRKVMEMKPLTDQEESWYDIQGSREWKPAEQLIDLGGSRTFLLDQDEVEAKQPLGGKTEEAPVQQAGSNNEGVAGDAGKVAPVKKALKESKPVEATPVVPRQTTDGETVFINAADEANLDRNVLVLYDKDGKPLDELIARNDLASAESKPAEAAAPVQQTPEERWNALSTAEREDVLTAIGKPEKIVGRVGKWTWDKVTGKDKAKIEAAWAADDEAKPEQKPGELTPVQISAIRTVIKDLYGDVSRLAGDRNQDARVALHNQLLDGTGNVAKPAKSGINALRDKLIELAGIDKSGKAIVEVDRELQAWMEKVTGYVRPDAALRRIQNFGTADQGDVSVKVVSVGNRGDGFGVETTVNGDRRYPTEPPMTLEEAQQFARKQLDNPRTAVKPTPPPAPIEPAATSATKPPSGHFVPPPKAFIATAEGQRQLLDRGGRIAMLQGLNNAVRNINPAAAYSDDQIESAGTREIDAMRDWLVDQQKTTDLPLSGEHQAPDGEIDPVTSEVIDEALAESVARTPSMTAQEKQKAIAAHLADVLKAVDAAIADAPAELSINALNNARDRLEKQIADNQSSLPAIEQRIADHLRNGLLDLLKEIENKISQTELNIKHYQKQGLTQYEENSKDSLVHDQVILGQITRLITQIPKRDADHKTALEVWKANRDTILDVRKNTGKTSELGNAITAYESLRRSIDTATQKLPTATDDKTITVFRIPGDGVFTIRNRKADLKAFRDKLTKASKKASDGLKEGLGATPNGKPEKFSAKSTPAGNAITALTKDKEGDHAENVANAWNLALANDTPVIISEVGDAKNGDKMLSGKDWEQNLTQNAPVLYVDAQPVDKALFPGLAPFNPVLARKGTIGDGVQWDVIDADAGAVIAYGGKKEEDAMLALKSKMASSTPEKAEKAINDFIAARAGRLGVEPTRDAIRTAMEARMQEWADRVQDREAEVAEANPVKLLVAPDLTPLEQGEKLIAPAFNAMSEAVTVKDQMAILKDFKGQIADIPGLEQDEISRLQDRLNQESLKTGPMKWANSATLLDNHFASPTSKPFVWAVVVKDGPKGQAPVIRNWAQTTGLKTAETVLPIDAEQGERLERIGKKQWQDWRKDAAPATAKSAAPTDRDALIEQILDASQRIMPEIVPSVRTKGSDGNWYSLGFPQGVQSTGETKVIGFVFRNKDGVTFGKAEPDRQTLIDQFKAKQQKDREEAKKDYEGFSLEKLQESAAYWLKKSEPVEVAPATKPAIPAKVLNLGTGSAERDEQLAKYRAMKKAGRGMTAAQESALERYESYVKADPAKWTVGDGVGWKVTGKQINRGFRIVAIDPVTKEAQIQQVADTGLTTSGGNNDRIGTQWVHIDDLVRDNKYKAPSRPQFSIAAELDAPVLSSAYALGASKPNLTPLQVLDMADAGEAVSVDEFAILQAYLSGVFAQTPALGVDSPSFKKWFGRSKMVSKKTGQPIKMYHATSADFTAFDLERSGKGTSHPTAAMGFFFSNDKGHAATKYGDNVMEVYLAIERPYLMTDADLRQIDGIEEAKAFREKLIAQGYDGIAMPAETSTRYVAAFYPDQIKLTNNETYTRGVDDIRYSRGSNTAPGLTQSGFVSALKRAFPYLSEALDKVLARGLRGEKGGTVLIDSNDPNEIARVYAEKTGRSFEDALKEIQASVRGLDELLKQAKYFGLTPGAKWNGVGKEMGGIIYVHRQYLNRAPQAVQNQIKAAEKHIPADFSYTHLKFNPKTGEVGFQLSRDFDTANEPTVNVSYLVKPDGSVTRTPRSGESDQQIWHHKWMWVDQGYPGFDYAESVQRSIDWNMAIERNKDALLEKTKGAAVHSKIGSKAFWESEIVPLVQSTWGVDLEQELPATWELLSTLGYKPENASNTQIANTRKTYVKVAADNIAKTDKVLDYSAGLGYGTADMRAAGWNVDDYEPFSNPNSRDHAPMFDRLDATDIPNDHYDTVLNQFVLNVVPEETRRVILSSIYQKVKPGGKAIILVRGWSRDVDQALKQGIVVGPEEILTSKRTFQKGFTYDSLTALVKQVLPGAEIVGKPKSNALGIVIRKPAAPPQQAQLRFSKATGKMQGFYDPRSGLIFAILPNLSPQSAPAVFLHETGHGQQRDDITKRAVDIINQRNAANGQYRAFLDRVNARLAAAGLINKDGILTDENEAAQYIIEQAVLEGRQNGFNYVDGRFMDWVDAKIGKPVGDLIRKLVNFIRAAMLRRGFPLNINKLTVDDLVSFAKIGVEKAARGEVRVVETETAATRSYAGPNAKTADQSLLQQAKARVDAGEDAEVVRKETGWFKNQYDQKWRFEIDDRGFYFNPTPALDEAQDNGVSDSEILKAGFTTKLGRVVRHKSLFDAYPELNDISVELAPKSLGEGTYYDLEEKTIRLEVNITQDQYAAFSVDFDPDSLIHEIQHVVQRIEGFATGGSPRETKYDDVPPDIRKLGDALTTKLTSEFLKDRQIQRDMSAFLREQGMRYSPIGFVMGDTSEKQIDVAFALSDFFDEKGLPDLADTVDNWLDAALRLTANGTHSKKQQDRAQAAFKEYQSLAGEIEARDTQNRLSLTPDQRRDTAPYRDTMFKDGIADSEVIVKTEGAGPQFSVSPTEISDYLSSDSIPELSDELLNRLFVSAIEHLNAIRDASNKGQSTRALDGTRSAYDVIRHWLSNLNTRDNVKNSVPLLRRLWPKWANAPTPDTSNDYAAGVWRMVNVGDEAGKLPLVDLSTRIREAVQRIPSETAPQFSIAPTQSPAELERISNAVDEAGGWSTDRETEKTIIDRLRGVWDKAGDKVQDSRKMWVKLLTRQQLVELISHIPGVGPLAQAFEKTARNLDAMKQELKQKVYPVAERWRDGIVRSRDNGYLLSKIIHASTLHGVDPLGEAPIQASGQTPQERAELADKLRWHGLVKQWMKELETKDPTLAKVYKESRDNYEFMRNERYAALMARIGRSGNSMVRGLLDQAEKGVDEAPPETLVAQLRDLKTDDAKQFQKVRGAILSVFPTLRPKPAPKPEAKAKPAPVPKPINEARALLDTAGRKVFDAVAADLQTHTVPGHELGVAAKTRYNRLFGQADRLAKEAANPAIKGFGRRLAGLFDADPKTFQALRDALVGYLKEPGALITIEDVADPARPGKSIKKVALTNLANSKAYQTALKALPEAAQGLFKEALESAQNRMADHSSTVKAFYESVVLKGPYAPLSRFGDYQVYAEKDGQPLPIYATFESSSEQLRAVKALKEEGWKVTVGHQIEDSLINSPPSGSFIGSLFGMIEETVASEQEQALLKDDVYQLYLHSLPDMSASKHFVHRKGIPGFSQDALRAYAQLMNQSANAIARLNYSDILQEQLQDMAKEVKRIGQDATDENIAYVNQAAPVVSELNASYDWLMNPSNATWANRLTGLGFFWYLTNFSTSLVNLTQTPLMTFPDLAARYGGKEAFSVLSKTIVDYGNWKFRRGESKQKVIDAIGQRFDGDMKRMLDHIEKSGAVSRTETVMLADMGGDVAEFQTSKAMVAVNKVRSILSWPFQKSEVANREIAAIAAYTLARNAGKDHQQAQDIAYNVVFRTQNDFSNANRAAWMRGNLSRVVLLFKSFAQMMTWRWLRDTHQMFNGKGVDPETGMELKAIARDRVKWMLVSSFMFSGAMGLPIYAMTMGLASLIAAMGSDPDDPWDVETEVNQAIQAAALALTNDKNSADVLRRLAMTGPVGTLFGIDLSPRVSMDVLRLWLRKVPGSKEGEDLGLAYLQQFAGPVVGGMGVGAVKGLNDLGNAWQQRDSILASRGLETMIPAPLRNVMKTMRYASEGVTTRRGDKIVDDPTALDLVRQFVGFTPAEIADQYERNAAVKELDRDLSQRRKNLVNYFVYALEQEDQVKADSALEAIREFSIKNPQIAISGNTLSQSYRGRQRARMLAENGLYIPSKGMRARLEDEGY